jgi:hypothetical protein
MPPETVPQRYGVSDMPTKLLLTAAPKYDRLDAVAHLLSSSDRGKNRPGSSQLTSSDRIITR